MYILSVSLYPACNGHALYCHLWPAPLNNIFPHYLKKARFSKKKYATESEMCVMAFSTNFVRKFLILIRVERDMIKKIYWSSRNH